MLAVGCRGMRQTEDWDASGRVQGDEVERGLQGASGRVQGDEAERGLGC